MYEVLYRKDDVVMQHCDITIDTLFELLKAHKEHVITIIKMEDSNGYQYDYESVISNLKL